MSQAHRVTVIPGDGVGPEVVRSAVRIIAAEGVTIDHVEVVPVTLEDVFLALTGRALRE